MKTKQMKAMNKKEAEALYKNLAEGMKTLYEQSQLNGDDVELNPARLYFAALGGFLADHDILDALAAYADYLNNHERYPKYKPEPLPVV